MASMPDWTRARMDSSDSAAAFLETAAKRVGKSAEADKDAKSQMPNRQVMERENGFLTTDFTDGHGWVGNLTLLTKLTLLTDLFFAKGGEAGAGFGDVGAGGVVEYELLELGAGG